MNWLRQRLRELSVVDEVALAFRFLRAAKTQGVMIDVGAHQGGSLASFAGKGWTIHAFEPDPRNQKVLQAALGALPNVHLNAAAVGAVEAGAVSFAVSSNSYIGSLTSFDASHVDTITVPLRTLANYCREHGLNQVDFLKVDAEGHDLEVLQGFPWKAMQPRLVICEFEDRKHGGPESGFRAMADFLQRQGYSLLVSEWDPVLSYHGPFRWRRCFVYPGDLPDPAGNGNILAVRGSGDFGRLRVLAALKALAFRGSMGLRSAYQALRRIISR